MKRIIKFPKVRITDHRPRAGAISSVGNRIGSTTGGSVSRSESMEHDHAIIGYGEETLLAAVQDLGHRWAWNRKDAEHRWIMGRVAAILRALDRKGALS